MTYLSPFIIDFSPNYFCAIFFLFSFVAFFVSVLTDPDRIKKCNIAYVFHIFLEIRKLMQYDIWPQYIN